MRALLWASPEAARTVIDLLKPADFYRPVCAALLFTVITRLVTESRPHRSAVVLAELPRAGKVSGLLSRALDVALADAREHEISHYARAVLAQSYRRGYATAAVTLAQLAAEASEDELFEQMCVLGRARRDAKARLDAGADSTHAMSTLAEEDFEVGAHAQRLHESGTPWSAIRTELVCTSDTARRLANAYVTLADERARKDQISLF